MLAPLQHIAEIISSTEDLAPLLDGVTREVAAHFGAVTCTVHVPEHSHFANEPALAGTPSGFRCIAASPATPDQINSNRQHQTLVQHIAAQQRAIILPNQQLADHPATAPDAGSSGHPVLGVPIANNGAVVAVITVFADQPRVFQAAEEAFLLTVSMQLARAYHRLVQSSKRAAGTLAQKELRLQGYAGAPGIAIGSAVFPVLSMDFDDVPDARSDDPEREEQLLMAAIADVMADLQAGRKRLSALVPDELNAIFDVYREMVGDDAVIGPILNRIRSGQSAASALRDTIVELGHAMEAVADARFRARAEDLRAVGRRLLLHLLGDFGQQRQYPDNSLLIGSEVSLARMSDAPAGTLAGVVSFGGSTLSHTAVLARSMGIPAVMGIGNLSRASFADKTLIVDGYQGTVIANPSPATLRHYQALDAEDRALAEQIMHQAQWPTTTTDGVTIPVHANISLLADIDPILTSGAAGIGLYRTEFPFMLRDMFPSEAEQTRVYSKILSAFAPAPVVMRSLDVGGDKHLSYLPLPGSNPALGTRGIRLSLDYPAVFISQIRAMLRAADGRDNLKILLPMVATVAEVVAAKQLIAEARSSLADEGLTLPSPELGVMIETPAMAYLLPDLAHHLDFFSIGSNDLTQYLMAAARDDPDVAKLHDHFQPAVLRAINSIIQTAHSLNRPVSVCGELASDPSGAMLMLGMGAASISVSPAALAKVKWVLRSVSAADARTLVAKVLAQSDVTAVRSALVAAMDQAGVGGLLRPGF